jgi:hypothetical protein
MPSSSSSISALLTIVLHVAGENEDACLGEALAYLTCGFQAVEAGHDLVHEDHIRKVLLSGSYGFAAVLGVPDDLNIRTLFQIAAEELAHDGVVVHHEDADAGGAAAREGWAGLAALGCTGGVAGLHVARSFAIDADQSARL